MRKRPKRMSYEALAQPLRKWARAAKEKTPSARWVAECVMARLWWLKHQYYAHSEDSPAIVADIQRLANRKLDDTATGRATAAFLLAERARHIALTEAYNAEILALLPLLWQLLSARAANAFWKWAQATAPNWLVIGDRPGEIVIKGLRMQDGS